MSCFTWRNRLIFAVVSRCRCCLTAIVHRAILTLYLGYHVLKILVVVAIVLLIVSIIVLQIALLIARTISLPIETCLCRENRLTENGK